MTDLSSLSDDQLKAMYHAPAAQVAVPDFSKMSDEDLKAAHAAAHPSVVADIAKSGGIGLAKGVIGLAGIGGDAGALGAKGLDLAADKLGVSPETVAKVKSVAKSALPAPISGILSGPTSEDIQKKIEGVTGEFYKPKTVAGEYAQTAGEFAPGVLGGGEGLLAKLASRVAAPALASETAGQLTKGTDLEPYARVAGAVTGGGLASALSRAERIAAPTVEELKDAARAQYNHPDVKNVRINPDATDFLHHWIRNDLESGTNSGFRAANEPKTFAAIAELSNPNASMGASVRAPATIDDIQSVRKVLGRIADERSTTGTLTSDAVAANRAIEHINTFLENMRQPDLVSGNAQRASQILSEAGGNWGAAKRAEEVATKAENARIQAASTYGGGNINNALRQALRPLVKNDFQKARGFNPDEQATLERAVTGSWAGNTARQIGKLGPDTGLKGIEHVIAAVKTGGASIPLSLAALGAKLGGDASTRRAIGRLDTMLRERSPLHEGNVASRTQPMIPSPNLPGMMINNPNYVPALPRQGRGDRALINAMMASTAPRLEPYRGANLGPLQER